MARILAIRHLTQLTKDNVFKSVFKPWNTKYIEEHLPEYTFQGDVLISQSPKFLVDQENRTDLPEEKYFP
jgi:hypothetical protein